MDCKGSNMPWRAGVTVEPYRHSILVHARQDEVFRYFTEPEAIVAWMGDEATVDPEPGGVFLLRFEDRIVEGRYVEITPPHRLVIGWGRQGSASFPPHMSRLEVILTTEDEGTRVTIVHHGLPAEEQARHALGWTYYLSRLGQVLSGQDVGAHRVPAELKQGVE